MESLNGIAYGTPIGIDIPIECSRQSIQRLKNPIRVKNNHEIPELVYLSRSQCKYEVMDSCITIIPEIILLMPGEETDIYPQFIVLGQGYTKIQGNITLIEIPLRFINENKNIQITEISNNEVNNIKNVNEEAKQELKKKDGRGRPRKS